MTLETATGYQSQTFLLLHPPGLSIRDADNVPEVVTKANPSAAFAVGAVVEVTANTAAGEQWGAYLGNDYGYVRYGHVTIASASGTTTMTIVRHPRIVLPCYRKSFENDALGDYSNRPPSYAPDATDMLATPVYRLQAQRFLKGQIATVEKPSGESWIRENSLIFRYDNGSGEAYTSSLATANAATKAMLAGVSLGTYGVGVTTAQVFDSLEFDPTLTSSVRYASQEDVQQLAIPVAITPGLGQELFADPARTQVLAAVTPTAAAPIGMGFLVGFDKSVTPARYYVSPYSASHASLDAIYLAWRSSVHCFVQCLPAPWPDLSFVGAGSNDVAGTRWPRLLCRFTSSSTFLEQTSLHAPRLICSTNSTEAQFPCDLALDVDLPSPWSALRVVWSPGPNTTVRNQAQLFPSTTRRTDPAVTPVTGMLRNAVPRLPPLAHGALELADQVRDRGTAGSFDGYGAQITIMRDLYLSGHPDVPHVCAGYQPSNSFALPGQGQRVRIGEIPTFTWYWSAPAAVEWAWGHWDYSAGAVAYVTGWNAASSLGGSLYSATIAPPALALGSVYRLQLWIRVGGATPVAATSDDATSSIHSWWDEVRDGTGYGVYPYDVLPAPLPDDADGAWVGHAGWHWPQPTITAPTWGAAISPSFTAATNTLTMPTNPTATRAADAAVGAVSSVGPNYQALRCSHGPTASSLLFVDSASSYSWWRDSSWSITQRFGASRTFRVPQPDASPVSANLDVLYAAQADSSYGRLYWPRVDRVTITWP